MNEELADQMREETSVGPEMHLALARVLPVCHGWRRAQRRG